MYRTLLMMGIVLLAPEFAGAATDGDVSWLSRRSRVEGRFARGDWGGADLHLAATEVLIHETQTGGHVLVFRRGFSLVFSSRRLTSDSAVVWVEPADANEPNDVAVGHEVRAYLSGHVSGRGAVYAQKPDVKEVMLERGKATVFQARVLGEVFVTAERRESGNPRGLPLFEQALRAFQDTDMVPPAVALPRPPGPAVPSARAGVPEKVFPVSTVGIVPLSDEASTLEWTESDTESVGTIIGRVYIWWQEPAEGRRQPRLLELEADSLVVWREPTDPNEKGPELSGMQQKGVSAIYVSGDVLLREGQQTIRAGELYYDLRHRRGVARNAVMRTFDVVRDVPVYVRARELRQLDDNRFEAEDITLTTSEFWTPQLSAQASSIRIVDVTEEADQDGEVPKTSYDAEMKDVRLKYYDATLLGLPSLRSNLQRPDVPIRSARIGHSSAFGTSVETQWFLSRILGLREPEGTDSTLSLDYYCERGPGGGVNINYERENYFGRVLGYIIEDHGEDRLGRTRKDVDVPDNTRGRFLLQHRHFLPYSWQLTAEASYLSDENFLEQFYRGEFNVGKEQETLLHLKRIEGNRGLSVLTKARVNDFLNKVEEVPSAQYHWTGQSFWDDRLLFFSDTQLSRYRYRYSSEGPDGEPDSFFAFTQTRNEIDLPLAVGRSKVVPFVAGTFAYEDGVGFQEELDGSLDEREDAVGIGEAGVRMSVPPLWRVYPDVESRLWDLHELRHVITPSLAAVAYSATDSVADQRNTLDLGIYQRWQTKRGPVENRRTVDWLELNLDCVWVNDSGDGSTGPDRFIWNKPFIPLANPAIHDLPPLDRRTAEAFGPRRNYTSAEVIMRLSDTTSILGDVYMDMQSGVVEQVDVGFSRLCWPDLTYYVGTRYLRDVDNGLGEVGSNALTFAATYVLDPRYTAVFSQQYDFDYAANIRTDITLIRKYHRLNYALTFSVDDSLDEQSVVFSLWPQGVPELGFGLRRYMQLGQSGAY